jgi:starch synthase
LTGGLVDPVVPYDGANIETANGFGFTSATDSELFIATWVAILNYREGRIWKDLQANAMKADFSWSRSAGEYVQVYERSRYS